MKERRESETERPSESPVLASKDLARCSTREARALVSYQQAVTLKALPLGVSATKSGPVISFAVPEGRIDSIARELRFMTGSEVVVLPVPEEILRNALFAAYHGDEQALQKEHSALTLKFTDTINNDKTIVFNPPTGDAARFLASLIQYALAKGASDLHLTPLCDGAIVRLRIDGALLTQSGAPSPKNLHEQMVSRIKVLAKLDPSQKLRPQDGAFPLEIGGFKAHVRVSTVPTVHGESVALRLISRREFRTIQELEMDPIPRKFLEDTLNCTSGVILFVGPTGSGKSTAMYAAATSLTARNLQVVAVEDPVEVEVPGMVQISVNERQGVTFPLALRSTLRQDPNALLVGEVRDSESAEVLFHAALTGHLILSTVHARSTADVVSRLVSLGVDQWSIEQALRLVVFQNLLPKLCLRCRVIDLPSCQELGTKVYRAVGCGECDYSGYRGRRLVSEALLFDHEIVQALKSDSKGLLSATNQRNFWPLMRSLEEALKEGSISREQFWRSLDNLDPGMRT